MGIHPPSLSNYLGMHRDAIVKVFILVFISIIFFLSITYGQSTVGSLLLKRLDDIENELKEIETSQMKVLEIQELMISDVKNLKIWVNKRRGSRSGR